MKKTLAITTAAIALAAGAEAPAAQNAEVQKPTTTAHAILVDGTSVNGEFRTKRISGSTAFAKKLDLDPAIVKSLVFSGTNGEAKVELANGDRFAMTVANENLTIKSILGDLGISRGNVRSISLAAGKKSARVSPDGLVFHCTFDDEASLQSPAAGPAVKLELGRIAKGEGKSGGALSVAPGIAGAEIAFPEGTFGAEGCIEFWANMTSGKTEFSTGGDPRFFVLFDGDGREMGHLEFASNDGCGTSGIGGYLFGVHIASNGGYTRMMPYSDVFKGEDYNGWHHYAYVWTPAGVSIFLDGKELCRANGRINDEAVRRCAVTMDIPLNRRTGKSYNNKSPFMMDELKIWNRAKTDFDL